MHFPDLRKCGCTLCGCACNAPAQVDRRFVYECVCVCWPSAVFVLPRFASHRNARALAQKRTLTSTRPTNRPTGFVHSCCCWAAFSAATSQPADAVPARPMTRRCNWPAATAARMHLAECTVCRRRRARVCVNYLSAEERSFNCTKKLF